MSNPNRPIFIISEINDRVGATVTSQCKGHYPALMVVATVKNHQFEPWINERYFIGGLLCDPVTGTGVPPASLAEWTLSGAGNMDFYDSIYFYDY